MHEFTPYAVFMEIIFVYSFVAKDSRDGTSANIVSNIVLCTDCSGNGICDYNVRILPQNMTRTSSFFLAPCECHHGFTGLFCQTPYSVYQ